MVKPRRLNIRVTDQMMKQLEREARLHDVSMTAIIETALERYFDNADSESPELIVIRRLDRMDLRQASIERDLSISLDMLRLYIFYWLTRTEPIPEGDRDAAHALGRRRMDHFLAQVARSGSS